MEIKSSSFRDYTRSFRIPLLIAFAHFFITTAFQFDKAFFEYDTSFIYVGEKRTYSLFWYYFAIKVLYAILLAVIYCTSAFVIRLYKAGSEKIKRGLYIFTLYFVILMSIFLLVYPGTWAWDDIGVVTTLHHLGLNYWQHFFTSIIQMLFLQIIPCPAGIIIVTNFIISALVSYCVVQAESFFLAKKRLFGSTFLDTLVKLLPFLSIGVLSYQFSGYRMGLYVYFELTLFTMAFSAKKEGKNWSFFKGFVFSVLSILVSEWRTEGMFFAIVASVFIFMQKKEICSTKVKVFSIFIIVFGFLLTDTIQKKLLSNSNYEVISTMTPVVELIRNADEKDEELIENLGRVLNIKAVFDYPDKSGTALYWLEEAHAVKENYTKADYKAYLKAFFALSLRHPNIVIKERFSMFLNTTAIFGKTNTTNLNTLTNSHTAFTYDNSDTKWVQEFALYPHNQPVFPAIRIMLLKLWANKYTYRLVWNVALPIIFLIIAWIYCIKKRKATETLFLSGEAVRVVLTFLTAPSPWFMYYLPEYLLGWTLLLYFALFHIQRLEKKVLNFS